MKAKIIAIIVLALFILMTVWLLNHTYVVINFWTAFKISGGALLALVATFFVGRWTKSCPKKDNSYGSHT